MGATDARARKCLELSQEIRALAETPKEVGAEHSAAQQALANMGYELAGMFLEALGGIPETPTDKLAVSKSLAQEVLDEYPADADWASELERAIQLLGQCEAGLEGGA